MLYMIVETFRGGDPLPVYRRFREQGRMAPEGLRYVASWVTDESIDWMPHVVAVAGAAVCRGLGDDDGSRVAVAADHRGVDGGPPTEMDV